MESSRNPSCFLGFGESSAHPLMVMPLISNSNQNTTTNHLLFPSQHSHEDYETGVIKHKIMSHPHYPKLLSAYINCQKVGAPPEVVARLEQACSSSLLMAVRASHPLSSTCSNSSAASSSSPSVVGGGDPSLDQFMEAYCEMLTKYEEELSKPFKEAMVFLSKIDAQFKSLSLSSSANYTTAASLNPGACSELERNGSSEEDVDAACENYVDPLAEDRELKGQLLRKYSGYLGSLKQEFLKKRKKGKLPKEARQQLLEWWNRHYKWPYPSESQKLALAESTGLDQKQINNWFINQRKRHWKPAEELDYVVMGDGSHPHYFIENGFPSPYPLDCTPALM